MLQEPFIDDVLTFRDSNDFLTFGDGLLESDKLFINDFISICSAELIVRSIDLYFEIYNPFIYDLVAFNTHMASLGHITLNALNKIIRLK